jgi:ATP-dependent RNA helicase RhlE
MTFKELNLIEPILKALSEKGYTNPTPIQEQAIPILLNKKDLLGCAQTGTGKTAAFAIPILQMMFRGFKKIYGKRKIRALIVTPTRELALQIGQNFKEYGQHTNLRSTVVFGGVKQGAQASALHNGVDILVATPGRLLDFINQGLITLKHIEYFVLDEADQMLDMGFINDIRKILAKLPKERQSLFFSATMPPSITELAYEILIEPERVTITPEVTTAEKVDQSLYFVTKRNKIYLLEYILKNSELGSTLVFSRTKHGADRVVRQLKKEGISADAIHGNKTQNARQRALRDFKEGKTKVLIATDIAARGIDISGLERVVNYDLPNVAESYVHRIGRTGRANASGVAISFCDEEERTDLRSIEALIKQKIPVVEDQPFAADFGALPVKKVQELSKKPVFGRGNKPRQRR